MQSIPSPTATAIEVFRACVHIVRNNQLRARLISVESEIETSSEVYEDAGENGQLFAIAAQTNVGGLVTAKEMSKLYNERMVRTGTPGRDYYDRIIGAPRHGKCPLCAHRPVATLDHYLAKSQHPVFAVVPLNLVPSCSDCNKAKEHHYPVAADEQTLHPYFDNVENVSWLIAKVQETSPASLAYAVADLEGLGGILLKRIRAHFSLLELGKLYASNAAAELVNIRLALQMIFQSDGIEGVKAYLRRQEASYSSANINSWQAAMYRSLAASGWYCEGGFN